MTETYLSLGQKADWHWYVPMGAVFVAMPFLLRPLMEPRKVNSIQWALCAYGICMIFGSLLGAPMELLMLLMPVFMALAMLFPWNDARMPVWGRGLAFAAFVGLGWSTVSSQVGRQKIVLGDSSVQIQQSPGRPMVTIDRVSTTVMGMHNLRRDPPGEFDWYLQRKDYALGPLLTDKDLYWGPHGEVRGDQIAFRVASWAGVKPQYDIYSY